MRAIVFLILISSLFTSPYPTQASPSDELPPIYLILDGSGSMWGQIEGKNKIGIARKVVGKLLDDMEPDRPVGLMVYGHRRKGDCEDIELMMEPGLQNRDKIKTILKGVNPVGKTPLANTALQLIEKIKDSDKAATIILVSDGAESCGGDLCAVIKAAKEAGVDFVLHIVGFDIGESDKLALQCAAQAGEGMYLDAANGNELRDALEQATELTVEATQASLSVKVSKDGALHDAAVQIFKPNDEQYFTSLRTYAQKESNPAIFHIPPGTYHVRTVPIGTDAQEIWRKDIVVPGNEVKQVDIDFTAGKISIHTTANQNLWDCSVNITKSGERKSVSGGRTYKSPNSNPMIKELSPGLYDVKISALNLAGDQTEQFFEGVEIVSGKTISLTHDFSYGELAVLATNNGALWDCVINVYAATDPKKKSVAGGRTYNSPNSNPLKENLRPGLYAVQYKAGKIHGNGWEYTVDQVEVKAGEKAEVVHNYQTGTLHIGGRYNGEAWTCDVTISQNGKTIYSKRASSPNGPREIILIPGAYEVEVQAVKLDATVEKFTITLEAGKEIERLVDF